MIRVARPLAVLLGVSVLSSLFPLATARAAVTRDEVERAIRDGVRYLKGQQRDDGSWPEVELSHPTGCTSLATLALLTAGESAESPHVARLWTSSASSPRRSSGACTPSRCRRWSSPPGSPIATS